MPLFPFKYSLISTFLNVKVTHLACSCEEGDGQLRATLFSENVQVRAVVQVTPANQQFAHVRPADREHTTANWHSVTN